jgi:hypothetical protein
MSEIDPEGEGSLDHVLDFIRDPRDLASRRCTTAGGAGPQWNAARVRLTPRPLASPLGWSPVPRRLAF